MDKRYTKLLRTLNENKDGHHVHISVGLNHDIMAVHDSKEAGMKYMVMGDGPDGHFLVKTTRKALGKKRVGQFVGRRISRHLDKQPFPHDDGPHYSVHKESVERAKNVVRGMGVDVDNVIRGAGLGPHAEKDKARAAKEQKPTLKSRAKNVVRGMGVDPNNVMRGMGFKESVLPSSITPPLAPKEDRDRSDRVRDHELAKRHHERQMTRDPENKKYHLQQASLHSAAEDAGAEVSRIAPGKLRDAANRDFEIKSKKALGESVELDEAPRRKGAPKMTGDSIAIQRAKDAAHNKAMGRTKTGRKKPVRTMTSTQKSLASLRGEEVEVNEAHTMVCKDCGDELNKPTTDCKNDCSDPNGSHWVKEYNEATEDDLPEAWTPGMRRAAARRMKVLAPRIKLGIKRSKNRTATKEKLMNRAVRKVKSDLIKKFTKGSSKTDLSPARRADMEKRIAKLGPRIKQLAQKQLPATRRMEADRKRNRNK